MPQITTPLVQVLNPGVQQAQRGTGFLAPAAQAGQTRLSTIQNREVQREQQDVANKQALNKEIVQKAVNIKGTADTLNQISQQGGDIEDNMRSFLLTKKQTLPDLGFKTEETDAALEALDSGGVEAVLKLANEASSSIEPFLKDTRLKANDFSKGTSFRIKKGGKEFIATPTFNKRTGKGDLDLQPLSGQFVSTLGETGGEQTARLIGESGGKEAAVSKEKADRTIIDDSFVAAERIPDITDALDLLKKVNTGGVNAVTLAVKQRLGLENSDEAALSTGLARQVLAQLRPIFGAQFTEREGARLDRIEASTSKSRAGNVRIIQDLLKKVERKVKQGIRVARRKGNDDEVEELEALLNFTKEAQKPKQEASLESSLDDLSKLSLEELQALRAKQGGQ